MFPTTKYMKHILCVESYKATKIKKNCTTKNDLSENHPKNMLMYILLWALDPLGPITLLVQHTYICTALYLYRTLMPPI